MYLTRTSPGGSRIGPVLDTPQGSAQPDPVRLDAQERVAALLAREFDAPVGVFDRSPGLWAGRPNSVDPAWPRPDVARSVVSSSSLTPGVPMLWSAPGAGALVWLVLPLDQGDSAWVGFTAPGVRQRPPWGPACPPRALVAWGREVLERLLIEPPARRPAPLAPPPAPAGPPGSARPEALAAHRQRLSEELIAGLRVSDPPERFQQLAARSIQEILGVEAVAWVPASPHEQVVLSRSREGLAPEGFRALVPDNHRERVRRINDPADALLAASPGVRRALVVAAGAEASAGWLVAVNPSDLRGFAAEDAELIQPVAALIHAQRTNARHFSELKELLFGVIRSLTAAIDAKDPYTRGHSERVGRIAVQLGEVLGLPPHDRGDLYLMGLLHDVGKIGVEDAVLKKNGPLGPEEYRQIQQHVRIGVEILKDLRKLKHLLPGIQYHHENYDGTGYPHGLAGDQIPLPARILAVADAFDAMSSTRPYRDRLSQDEIARNLRQGAGSQWDPRIVEALFSCLPTIRRIQQKGLGDSVLQVVGETLNRP